MNSQVSAAARRMRRILLAAVLGGAGLTGATLSVAGPVQATGSSLPAIAVGTRISESSPCQQAVFIGSEGSGQTGSQASGLGPEVYGAWLQYMKRLPSARIGYYPNPYPAAPADMLSLIGSSTYRDVFADSLDSGVREIVSFLSSRASCPNEHYVLAGFSQGAMVSHRALKEVLYGDVPAQADDLLDRIDGTILIADGDRRGQAANTHYGTAPQTEDSRGIGWDPTVSSQLRSHYLPALFADNRIHDVCVEGDSICDFSTRNPFNLEEGFDLHGSAYSIWGPNKQYAKTGLVFVRSAATNVAKQTAQRIKLSVPTQITTESLPTAITGTRYKARLATADNRPGSWSIIDGRLPSGLALKNNTISGKPLTAGRSDITISFNDGVTPVYRTLALTVTGTTPPDTIDGHRVKQISAGADHTCAVLTTGAAVCWGLNYSGQLGNGATSGPGPGIFTPVPVTGLSSGVASISAGQYHTCAVLTSGAAVCWGGLNGAGGDLIGNGSSSGSSTPVPVTGLSSGVASISAAPFHTCAVLTNGAAVCWGHNYQGELGHGTTYSPTPVPVTGLSIGVTSISAGLFHTCAVLTSGNAVCWGSNGSSQLGTETASDPSSPVPGGVVSTGVTAISAGSSHTCAMMKGGDAMCWGDNRYGALGTTTGSSPPTPVTGLPSGATSISAGDGYSCAVLTHGGAACWGVNYVGELGNGTFGSSSPPMLATGLSNGVDSISAGYGYGSDGGHTCAVLTNGAAVCWGSNEFGQLGSRLSSGSYKSSTPATVTGLDGNT